jgi:transposase
VIYTGFEIFFPKKRTPERSPMNSALLFEGSDSAIIGFDIETYGPIGFPQEKFCHVDLYERVRRFMNLPSCSQKTVRSRLGFERVVDYITGASYHTFLMISSGKELLNWLSTILRTVWDAYRFRKDYFQILNSPSSKLIS